MKHRIANIFTVIAWASIASTSAIASGDHKSHAGHGDAAKTTATKEAGGAMSDGEVRRIDRAQGKITLKHGEIKNLDMSPMTMVFRVNDPALLDRVKEGDRVGFSADKIGGEFTVTGIEVKK